MYALQEVNQPSTQIPDRGAPGVPPLRQPPPAMIGGRHRCRTVPQALVSRLSTGRQPTPQEVEAVACRIW